jgi:hypothetical protein
MNKDHPEHALTKDLLPGHTGIYSELRTLFNDQAILPNTNTDLFHFTTAIAALPSKQRTCENFL